MKTSAQFVALAATLGLIAGLSACTSTSDEGAKQAAAFESTEASEPESPEPTLSEATSETSTSGDPAPEEVTETEIAGEEEPPLVGASIRGARVCVVNSLSPRPDGTTPSVFVEFTRAEKRTKETGTIQPGEQVCGQHSYSSANFDVEGRIVIGNIPNVYPQDLTMDMYAWNSARSSFSDQALVIRKPGVKGECARTPQFAAEDWVFDDKTTRFFLKQLPDSKDFKEWTVTLSNGQEKRGGCK